MSHTRAERAPDLWIVQNPWLRNAFRRDRAPSAAPPVATRQTTSHVTESAEPVDVDALVRRLNDLDESAIANVCAAIERHLHQQPSGDPAAALHKAAAVGLAIGYALRRPE
jgi:hypothetical protein